MKRFLLVALMGVTMCHAFSQEIKYSAGNNGWNADSLGNHRAVVQFTGKGNVAKADILWRRSDKDPQQKRIIVEDSATRLAITNVITGDITGERGVVLFEPVSGKGVYYIYYMPYKNEGRSNYPKGVYLSPDNHPSADWMNAARQHVSVNTSVREIQSIDTFNSFYPMEVIATEKETSALISKSANKSFIIFPEDRMYPVRMKSRLPYRWVKKGLTSSFSGIARRGEYYAYQLAVYGLKDLANLDIRFTDLKGNNGAIISSQLISCVNTSGTDYTGHAFTKRVNVSKGDVQVLWCGVDIPVSVKAGTYKGSATLKADGASPSTVNININVTNAVASNHGADEPQKQTRLTWLNSTLAQENSVIAPYTPLKVKDSSIALLGRNIELSADGFPRKIQTFFTPEMTGYSNQPNELLAAPVHFNCVRTDGTNADWKNGQLNFTTKQAGTVAWTSSSTNALLNMQVSAKLEFDGFIQYQVKLTAMQDATVKDLSLDIPFNSGNAKYMMGLGLKGGRRPADFKWKWEVEKKNQDGAWVGNVNAGLQYSLRDENYVRPLNTNFYLLKPLLLPKSWGNDNKGGINMSENENEVLAHNYSGERTMKKGDTLFYNFTLLITPFHPINTDFQWDARFYHRYNEIDSIKATGATVINIHHATPINPWINYPFIEWKKMKAYIDEAHSNGLKVKIYNTVRELSDRAYELFPMRSLGHEIYSAGKGGGFSWLQEHVVDDYIPAWFVPEIKDAAIINSGMSRWHNYYVEGMNWLVQHVGIDGIYLDDVAFDRITMKRIKRVLTKDGHPGIIDLHSANQYNKNDGFNNSADLYMEHFPYLNRLWFGEYFDYENNSSDFFLTEVSGIPFGLMGEMLQDGGNPWRGMIYGMTNRMPWSASADPRPLWKLWDDFGMKGSEMIGYWSDNCPVKTSNPEVLATVYKKKGSALVSIASWAAEDTAVQLQIDWKQLGIDPLHAKISAPAVRNFQDARTFNANDQIAVQKRSGWLLVIKQD